MSELPKDSQTLLRTPRTVQTTTKCGGTFGYVGIENGINKAFSFLSLNTDAIKLVVNIDGLPLSKSSSSQLWPILGSINNSNLVFPIAIFHAYAKPNSLADYLSEFIVEAKTLLQDGVRIENKLYQFNLQAIICDAPARSFLKCIIGHTGYHSCERCKIKGQYLQNRIVFNDFGADERRTDQEFRSLSYQHSHQKNEISPLTELNLDMIKHFPLDYMHLVLLGVVKRLLNFLTKGPPLCRISNMQSTLMSEKLLLSHGKMPSEFNRQPRSLTELPHWKASEFRQFLLYHGPIVLKGIVSNDVYNHFLALHVSMCFLLSDGIENQIY